ncbi:MAG TPA: 1-phosphofructokinase [Polyangia bacterium]|nr:1-phosphofructokinase [Polyangia bacterium]
MIITLTVNPAVDQTLWVDHFRPGHVNRPTEVHLDPAGKGINVSRMVHRLGRPTIALGFLGGDIGHLMQTALQAERVQNHFVPIAGQTRINVTIVDRTEGLSSNLYGPGPRVTAEELGELDEMLECWFKAGRVLVLAGSLLPGIPEDFYARYIERARACGVKTILDADGPSLRQGIAAQPFLIKPNQTEAEHLLGRPLPRLEDVARGARELSERGISVVVISLGAAGAVCAYEGNLWHVLPPKVQLQSTVGSGDSLVAGMAVELADGGGVVAGLRLGTAAGAATALSAGTSLGTPEDVKRLLAEVQIKELQI